LLLRRRATLPRNRSQGTGVEGGARPEECHVCNGGGEVLRSRMGPSGARTAALGACPACGGRGTAVVDFCCRCGGEGRARVRRTVRVRVPSGVASGSVLRIRGQGEAGRCGGPPGDLLVKLKVYPAEWGVVERRGNDLHSDVELSPLDAVLGTTVSLATARGARAVDVPPGTCHGAELVLEQAGVAHAAGGGTAARGRHVFTVRLAVPSAESWPPAARALALRLRALARAREGEGDDDARPGYSAAFGIGGEGDGDGDPPHAPG
jgi:molecular chaperone DnaJ